MVSNEDIKRALERKKSGQSDDIISNDRGSYLHPESKKVRDGIKSLGLSPAESMYILNHHCPMKEIITVTFLDMINRNILETTSQEVTKGVIIKKDKTELFIQEGSAFNDALKPYEEVFQKAIENKPELTFPKYTKELIKKLGVFTSKNIRRWDFPHYRNKIRDPLMDLGYYEKYKTKSLGFIPKTDYRLTDYGLDTKNNIENLLSEGGNPNNTEDQSNTLKTDIFLLKQDDEEKLDKFSKELSKQINKKLNKMNIRMDQ